MSSEIGVVGAGGWGTALAKVLADKGERVTLWCHGADSFAKWSKRGKTALIFPAFRSRQRSTVTQSFDEAVGRQSAGDLRGAVARGARSFRRAAAELAPDDNDSLRHERARRGESANDGRSFSSTFSAPGAKDVMAFLSGPTFALEVARGLPAAVTVAAYDESVARIDPSRFSAPHNFRVYTSPDVIGVQIGGVVKNVIAIAAGISDGLGLGQNARAALITRGLAEMTRLAVRMGADPLTLAGLPGLGDLILTCAGDLSRNRAVGLQIARGKKLAGDYRIDPDRGRGRAQYPFAARFGGAAWRRNADRRADVSGALCRQKAGRRGA